MKTIYKCPVCDEPLQRDNRMWRCSNNHTFDISREGYVNLLLAHQKKSKNAGDSKMMIDCRRRFLNQGYYDPLLVTLGNRLAQLMSDTPFILLDVGCGEGYYSHMLLQQLPQCQMWGGDISKPAVSSAAKRYNEIEFFVASNYRLPVSDQSIDVALKIYAPADLTEISRVVADNGYFISVIPGRNHLYQLKELIYDVPQYHDELEDIPEGFVSMDRVEVCERITLSNNEHIKDLLAMTPYYWHISESRQQSVASLSTLTCQIHFIINIYRKTSKE